MWLLGRLAPDFKTIADFRKNNGTGIKNACRSVIEICRQLNLFTDAVVAIDGSKFKAVNSKENNYTPKKVQFHVERVEKHIDDYLAQLAATDQTENETTDDRPLQEKIDGLKQRLAELKAMEEEAVNDHPDKQVSTTDPDSRLLKTQGIMTRAVCYNVQSAVDAKHHLIVAHDVTNKNDRGSLVFRPMFQVDIPRQEFINPIDRVISDALQNMLQVGLRVNVVELAGTNQAV